MSPTFEETVIATLAEDLPVGVWVARAPDGAFVYANRTFADIMGMDPRADVAVGEYAQPYGIYDLEGRLYAEEKLPFVRALAERKTVMVDDLVIHRHDGRRVHVRAFAKPVFDAADTLTHVIICFFDITTEVEAKRGRAESEARLHLAQRMEAVGKLAGGIAHDFNNLLTVIRSLASTMAASEPSAERRESFRMIDEVGERAMQLTRGLLGFAGRKQKFPAAVSLNVVLGKMAQLLERTLDKRIELVLELQARSSEIAGDLSQLEQVVMNLVVNARDAMPDGGRLTLRTRERDGRVLLEVADTGVGIDPAIRHRIFEPYFTTKGGREAGTGLGLATAYGIVESHRGTIEALDGEPRGTLMRLSFPHAAPGTLRMTPPEPGRPMEAGAGLVLLVEDEKLVRVATFRALKQLGYDVVACADGDEAVDVYRARHHELEAVVLDLVMPKLSGVETIEAMREIDDGVPVLLTSGYASDDELKQLRALGVRAFLNKPYDIGELSRALAEVISGAADVL
ncbi:MAG TPA: ATP-binding protein [Polyangia bacterium]|nr:ATP-binding protein [Polyangia bacterium]